MKIKHIFLTGDIQVGKSTLIRGVLSELEKKQDFQLKYDGFITFFDQRWSEKRNLCMERMTSDSSVNRERKVILQFEGKPLLETLAYETCGMEILNELDTKQLLIFDECGKFEKNSPDFIGKITEILDGDTHVLGVLRKDDSIDWLKRISERQDVCAIEVTEENRNALKENIISLLLKMLGEG
ncbi:MAG: nucleoside-triphosphatase [Schaedlerella sp.]|nr:nucleoside-triphosphatase [Schaedlerella sp.]